MAKSVSVAQLHTDILEELDIPSGGRVTSGLLDRTINRGLRALHALLGLRADDDWITHIVGVEVLGAEGDLMSLALPQHAVSSPSEDWWKLRPNKDGSWPEVNGEAPVIVGSGSVDAPPFWKLRKIQILESFTRVGEPEGGEVYQPIYNWTGYARDLERMPIEDVTTDVTERAWTYSDPPRYRLQGSNMVVFDRLAGNNCGLLIHYMSDAETITASSYLALEPLWEEFLIHFALERLLARDKDADWQIHAAKLQDAEAKIRRSGRFRDGKPPKVRDAQSLDRSGLGHRELRDQLTYGRWWPHG